MNDKFSLSPINFQKLQTSNELRECNNITLPYGLQLTEKQITNMVEKRFAVLQETGRIEFGDGIIKKIIYQFCDSPYISQETYEEIIWDLLDSFYYFKNDTLDLVSDDELIKYMRVQFDLCEGDIDYLNGTSLEALSCYIKNGYKLDDRDGKLF